MSTLVKPADRITVARLRSQEQPSKTHAHGRRRMRCDQRVGAQDQTGDDGLGTGVGQVDPFADDATEIEVDTPPPRRVTHQSAAGRQPLVEGPLGRQRPAEFEVTPTPHVDRDRTGAGGGEPDRRPVLEVGQTEPLFHRTIVGPTTLVVSGATAPARGTRLMN
jgi:hypothetical protein